MVGVDYGNMLRDVRINKFQLLKLRKMVICDFHPLEGCSDCRYRFKCELREV